MAGLPVKNVCTPDSIFGGHDQYLFLGVSVMSFTTSMGLGGQQGDLTVQLVEDTCASPGDCYKVYRDEALEEQHWTAADPGFFGDTCSIIGAPVYFRVKDFEYSGIIQSWERTHSTSGNPTYEVKISDPSFLLENTKVVINEFLGNTLLAENIQNLFNFYYTNEAKRPVSTPLVPADGAPAPLYSQYSYPVPPPGTGTEPDSIAGNQAGWFGASSDHNENGMKWVDFEWAAKIELASEGAPGIVFVDNTCTKWMGMLNTDPYLLDISEMKNIGLPDMEGISDYYRIDQPDSSIMEVLNQVIQEVGCDYYVELLPVKSPTSETIIKVIKLRIIDRSDNIMPEDSIQTYVDAIGTDREVTDYRIGKELRNEITQTYILGGARQSVFEAGNAIPGSIIPYFGVQPITNNTYIPVKDANGFWWVDISTIELQEQLNAGKYGKSVPANILITEKEMIIAQAGFDAWHSYASWYNTELWQAMGVTTQGMFDLKTLNEVAGVADGGNVVVFSDFFNTSSRAFKGHDDMELEMLGVAYAWLNKFVSEYYGKKFQVPVPWDLVGTFSVESRQIRLTERPSDGGWTGQTSIIALPGPYKDYFRLEDGRFGNFIYIADASNLEISNFAKEDFLILNGSAWIKVSQEQEWGWEDGAHAYETVPSLNYPRFVITLPQQIREVTNDDIPNVPIAFNAMVKMLSNFDGNGGILNNAEALTLSQSMFKVVGANLGHEGSLNRALVPNAAACCIISDTLRYGPWGNFGVGTKGGDINFKFEEGLVPWEYGGHTLLNEAGNELAEEGITIQQESERGTVSIVGFPDIPLGAELLAIDNNVLGGNNLYENRSMTVTSEPTRGNPANNVWSMSMKDLDKWDGINGPNVTSVTCRVSPSGVTTTYDIRIFTQKFGRFARQNANRLRDLGKFRLALSRYFRAYKRNRIVS